MGAVRIEYQPFSSFCWISWWNYKIKIADRHACKHVGVKKTSCQTSNLAVSSSSFCLLANNRCQGGRLACHVLQQEIWQTWNPTWKSGRTFPYNYMDVYILYTDIHWARSLCHQEIILLLTYLTRLTIWCYYRSGVFDDVASDDATCTDDAWS
jgi:hypothetical protein